MSKWRLPAVRVVAASLLALVVAAGFWVFKSRAHPADEHEIGSYADITRNIRAGLGGTKSRCELGPPSLEDQADWHRLQEPRELGSVPFADLLRRSDTDLSIEVSSRLFDELYTTGLGAMTEPERNVQLVNELQGEVSNGGFHQYFANSSGDCALKARNAARAIQPELLQIFDRALARFPDSIPSEDRATRNAQMASLTNELEAWSQLDDEFYKVQLDEAVVRYIRTNSALFDSAPQVVADK